MSYSIAKSEMIDYPPETLLDYDVTSYEWIDNLNFTIDPQECVENADDYISMAKKIFKKNGWHGDGEIQLMFVPPFMLSYEMQIENTKGIIVWHVKQKEDGISWLLFPKNSFGIAY
jgi:hypothetical protein